MALVVLLGACARNPAPVAVDAVAPPIMGRGVSVHLLWTAPVDLDLYVTDPSDETFYYGNPGTVFGGDVQCDDDAAASGGVETVHWTTATAGRYRVGVDFPERCGGDGVVPYRLLIDVAGTRRRIDASATHLQRVPNVEEFMAP